MVADPHPNLTNDREPSSNDEDDEVRCSTGETGPKSRRTHVKSKTVRFETRKRKPDFESSDSAESDASCSPKIRKKVSSS